MPIRCPRTPMYPLAACFAILLTAAGLMTGCNLKTERLFQGRTMGTTYMVKVATSYFHNPTGLKEEIDRRLAEINASMSTYKPDSEISRFNALDDITAEFRITDDFNRVMTVAREGGGIAHTCG